MVTSGELFNGALYSKIRCSSADFDVLPSHFRRPEKKTKQTWELIFPAYMRRIPSILGMEFQRDRSNGSEVMSFSMFGNTVKRTEWLSSALFPEISAYLFIHILLAQNAIHSLLRTRPTFFESTRMVPPH